MSERSPLTLRTFATAALSTALTLCACATDAMAQPATTLAVEAMTPDLSLAPLPGRRTANGFGRSFCSAPAAQEPLRGADVRMGRMRDVLSLRTLAGAQGRIDLNPAHLTNIARLVCQLGSDPNLAPWLLSYEQALINGLDLDDAALDALVAAALTQDGRRWSLPCGEEGGGSGPTREGEGRSRSGGGAISATPDQVIFGRIERMLCTGTAAVVMPDEAAYWLDAGTGLEASPTPNLHRFLYVGSTLNISRFTEMQPEFEIAPGSSQANAALFVVADIERLDLAAARRELQGRRLSDAETAFATATLARIGIVARAYKRDFVETMQSDPILTRVYLDAPRDAIAAFERDAAANAAALRTAWSVQSAYLTRDRGVLSSCADAMRGHFLTYVRARNPRREDDIRAAMDQPVGYILASALMRCETQGEDTVTGPARAIGELIFNASVQRGPRTAAYAAAARQAAIESNERPNVSINLQVEALYSNIPAEYDWTRSTSGLTGRGATGTVRTATRRNGLVRVEFRTDIYQEPLFRCTHTGRIARIERDGTVVYEQNSVVTGHQPVAVTPEAVDIPEAMAEGIAPGVHLTAFAVPNGTLAYPIRIRPTVEGDVVSAFGVAIGR